MPKHRVELTVPSMTVANADVQFHVQADGVRLGTLTISQGGIDWRPAKKQSPRRATWEQFDRLMSEG